MLFAILFVLAFIAGLLIYRINHDWKAAVSLPIVFFIVTTLLDQSARSAWLFTLVFGVPIVFFASLLGAYVVQTRTIDTSTEENTDL